MLGAFKPLRTLGPYATLILTHEEDSASTKITRGGTNGPQFIKPRNI